MKRSTKNLIAETILDNTLHVGDYHILCVLEETKLCVFESTPQIKGILELVLLPNDVAYIDIHKVQLVYGKIILYKKP